MAANRPQRAASGDGEPSLLERRQGEFWGNVVLGVVVMVVVWMMPLVALLAPVAAGMVAGYLQAAGVRAGAKIGAVAGLFGVAVGSLLSPPVGYDLFSGGAVSEFFLLVFGFGFVVFVIANAFGGVVGASIAERRRAS